MIVAAVLSLNLFTSASAQESDELGPSCYFDSDCNDYGCCSNDHCVKNSVCRKLRAYPKESFQTCYVNNDCISECCHNNFCTLQDTCDSSDTAIPMAIFMVIIGFIMIFLMVFFIRDVLLFRKNKRVQKAQRSNSNLLIGTSLMNDKVNPDGDRADGKAQGKEEDRKMEFEEFMKQQTTRKLSGDFNANTSADMSSDLNSSRSSSRSGGGNKRNRKTLRKELGYGVNEDEDQDYNYQQRQQPNNPAQKKIIPKAQPLNINNNLL
ncbi:UNKNOWN [Stylonychia lemnae]|uniref:Uncharacterized protein n=1 Tax=Stylonychia lemnae TaxID=5949 RepID=A0A078A8H6_STYLE|nr:UNKNOWN [Stylonychia lemnae]|eukprot:CDW78171.1 UNKNOWN [Stylonychia lemnae]